MNLSSAYQSFNESNVILLVFVIIALCILFSAIHKAQNKKKRKREEEEKISLFSSFIDGAIKLYDSPAKQVEFAEIYTAFMGKAISAEKDITLKQIPEMEKQYKTALGNLVAISKNNTVFFTSKEETVAFEESVEFLGINQKITQDILVSLPPLIEFIDIHQRLVINTYDYLRLISRMHSYLWMGLRFNISDIQNPANKTMKEAYDNCCKMCFDAYAHYVEDLGWDIIVKEYPKYDNKTDHIKFVEIAESTVAREKWMNLWCKKFDEITQRNQYATLYSELFNFLHKINELHGNPAWLECPTERFSLDLHSTFTTTNIYDIEELTRIKKAYESGQLKGPYLCWSDPNSKEYKKLRKKE